jgi:integrase
MNNTKPFMLRDPETISYEELKLKLSTITKPNIKILACFLYASGCRISEALMIKRKHLYFQKLKGKEYLTIKAPVLKKGKSVKMFRHAVVSLEEEWLVGPIVDFVSGLVEEDFLFPVSRATAYRYMIRFVGINPHGFRKLRATHLCVRFGFNDQQLVRFFGWSNSVPASVYTRLNVEDIAYGDDM